jgi:hypothetical protein
VFDLCNMILLVQSAYYVSIFNNMTKSCKYNVYFLHNNVLIPYGSEQIGDEKSDKTNKDVKNWTEKETARVCILYGLCDEM